MIDDGDVKHAIHRALASGADFAEVFGERVINQTLALEDRRLESVSSGQDSGAGVRVIKDGRTGYALTNVLTREGLEESAAAAAALVSKEGTPTSPVDLREIGPSVVHHVEQNPFDIPPREKVEWLLEVDDAARSKGPEVVQVIARLSQGHQEVLIANSEGTLVREERTRVSFAVMVVASRNGDMQRAADTLAATSGIEVLNGSAAPRLAAQVAGNAVLKLDAIPCPSGEMPVVIGARATGVLFHEACGHPCEADNIVKGISVYLNLEGKKVAEPFVTIVDDATVPKAWGSFSFDDEGVPAQRTYLVKDGILTSYLVDRLQGMKLGRSSTGNGRRQSYEHIPIPRMTNTFLVPGDNDPDAIIRDTKKGVWVGKMAGGQVNPVTGDFVFGTDEAFLIENGELTKPLKGANLIGDGPTILSRIEVVGSDFEMGTGTCGKDGQFAHAGLGQPTLRVTKLTVGGTS